MNYILGRKLFPQPPEDHQIECPYCGKKPHEIQEFIDLAEQEEITPVQAVKNNDSTYCQYSGLFVCSSCYINIGMPLLDKLHGAFPYFRMDVQPLEGQDNNALVKYRLGEL